LNDAVWESMWAPYDKETYERALGFVPGNVVVLDIGAGDLRFARRLAGRARRVYAIEQHRPLVTSEPLPANLIAIYGDARALPFPAGIDTAVLLMRHCRHFRHYFRKLEAVGCNRLITNARWGVDVECIDMTAPPIPFRDLSMGWYACRCGSGGFRPGPPEQLSPFLSETIFEVNQCPECCEHGWNRHRLS
jgi:hypothetical protein